MYLHLGEEKAIISKDVVLILNLDTADITSLANVGELGFDSKTLIVSKKTNTVKYIQSIVSSETIRKRAI